MSLTYMQNLKDNLSLSKRVSPCESLSMSEIKSLELKYNSGKKFPLAFREYLSLAGKYFNCGFDDMGLGLDALQERAQKELVRTQQSITRPFFVFHQRTACEYFVIIFLDEGKDDPDTYVCSPWDAQEGNEPLFKANGFTFSGLVNESIRRVKYDIPF